MSLVAALRKQTRARLLAEIPSYPEQVEATLRLLDTCHVFEQRAQLVVNDSRRVARRWPGEGR